MLNDRAHKFASKKVTSWSKYQLPGYWFVLQVAAVAGFAIYLLMQMGGGGAADVEADSVPSFEEVPSQGVVTDSPGQSTDPIPSTPDGTGGAVPTSEGTTGVVDAAGAPVQVPTPAAELASRGLAAMFNPDVAATVPVLGGGTLPSLSKAFPDATVGSLVFVMKDGAERLVFAAATDADGAGTSFGSVSTTITVVREGDSWLVESN